MCNIIVILGDNSGVQSHVSVHSSKAYAFLSSFHSLWKSDKMKFEKLIMDLNFYNLKDILSAITAKMT